MNPLSVSALLLSTLLFQDGQGGQKPRRKERDPEREKYKPAVPLPDDFVRYVRVPEGGREPQVALRAEHPALLLFARGAEGATDLYVTRSRDEGASFDPAVRVNAEAGAVATFDGRHSGSLELGPDGRAHVTWISAGPTPTICYTRENAQGGFEPALTLGSAPELGMNVAVTVDGEGSVYLFYGALETDTPADEAPVRRIFLRKSVGGGPFSAPAPIGARKHDVSTLSTIDAHVDELMGTIFVLYRGSYDLKPDDPQTSRDMRLLSSENKGIEFKPALVGPWKRQSDPRTFSGLVQQKDTTICCWEGDGNVYWAAIRRQLNKIEVPSSPREDEALYWRASAAAGVNGSSVLVAWLERPREERKAAPTLAWEVWNKEGRVPMGSGRASEAPGLFPPAVIPRKVGFTVLY